MKTQTQRTMCPMNCHPTLCGMQVTIENGKPVDIQGDPEHPDSRGFLCLRGKAAKEIIANPERIILPRIRQQRANPIWTDLSWSEAMERICSHLKQHPAESLGIWLGHGDLATNYGTRLGGLLSRRFAQLYGANWWHPAMVCWGLGGFGLGLTGILEVNTKEDMGDNSDLIIVWGASMASQPNTLPHLKRAKARGAQVISIDVRQNETSGYADRQFLVKPRSDAALALAMMCILIENQWLDIEFINSHSVGFERLAEHIQQYTPAWGAEQTGLSADDIQWLTEQYANTERAMILLGGSSMHKHRNGWIAPRAIACLPALTGKLAKPGAGLGPRHGANAHGPEFNSVLPDGGNRCQNRIPDQMPAMLNAMEAGQIKTLLLCGTNMLCSFADTTRLHRALQNVDMIICHDLFENDTIREVADVVLPATAWLEQLGCKMTNTHLYLMDKLLEPPGEAHTLTELFRGLAEGLAVTEFFPWQDDADYINAVIHHPSLGNPTIQRLRESAGMLPIPVSHIAYPDHDYPTPSGKIEFYSEQAKNMGLAALPTFTETDIKPVSGDTAFPLRLTYGRTLTHFHSFYDHGNALPTLNARQEKPTVWIAVRDAESRNINKGDAIRVYNAKAEFQAVARVTQKIPGGTVWIRDGWYGLNDLSSSEPSLPDSTVDLFAFGTGQAAYEADVEVQPISKQSR